MVEMNSETPNVATVKKQLLETLNNVQSEEKINFLINRLVNIDIETSKARGEAKNFKEQANLVGMLQKKVSTLEKSLSKTEVAKTKLEDLCRELNRSKKESDRNYQKLRQVEETNREAMENFKVSLGDIQKSVDSRKEQAQRMQDVEHLSTSLANLSGEYEKRLSDLKTLYEDREQTIKNMLHAKDEELVHLKKQIDDMADKIKKVFGENVELKRELMVSEQRVKSAIESELETRKMIEGYTGKYTKLMETLELSNKSFDKAKVDMEKMNAQLIKLQGDVYRSKKQVEESNAKVLVLTAEKLDFEKEANIKNQQIEKLKNLCRELQKGNVPADTKEPDGESSKVNDQ